MSSRKPVGVLLAAGSGIRFGGDKLRATLPDGRAIGVASLQNLLSAIGHVVAVVREDDVALAQALARVGARVTACPDAALGMGASLAWGIRAAPVAAGWVVALADMPWVKTETVTAVADALAHGADIVAPSLAGVRGHPVGFAGRWYADLVALHGDEGAKQLLAKRGNAITLLPTDDAGIARDVDRRNDLDGQR